MLRFILFFCLFDKLCICISIHIMLHFIVLNIVLASDVDEFQYILCYASFFFVNVAIRRICISIHTMLRFIPRKYKIPLLRDIYILAHKSAFFNTFYQPFLYFFHHNTLYLKIITYISRFPTSLIHLRLVKIRTITNTLIL